MGYSNCSIGAIFSLANISMVKSQKATHKYDSSPNNPKRITKWKQHRRFTDCGVYMATYAEYLSGGLDIPVQVFDVNFHHTRYGALLWEYANRKQDAGVISDNEAPEKPVRPRFDYDTHAKIMIN